MLTHRRTAIKSCHATGKTRALALSALWWLARYPDGIVLTTSPTFRQVRTQLWSEIHTLVAGAKVRYPKINIADLTLRGDANFAMGLSTNRAESFQGYHGQHVLIIVDEATGIEAGIWEAIAGIMASGQVHLVIAGNPTNPSGAFYEAFHHERALWNCITISAFDSPNLQGLTLDDLLKMDPAKGGPLDQNRVPFLVSRRWVREQYLPWWHGDESSSPIWMSRVLGEFPDQATDALFKLRWLERAKARALINPVRDSGRHLIAGVDVGGGGAETVVYICERIGRGYQIIDAGFWRAEDTRGEVVRFLKPYRSRLTEVRVDGIGIGHNFGLHLSDQGFPVKRINVSRACTSRPHLGENDPVKRFTNLKARYYQNLADSFERDEVDGLVDDETIAQLADLRYEIDSQGRMRIEPKAKALARRSSSPDRAEALMLAIGERHEPNVMTPEFIKMYFNQGLSNGAIADKLELSLEQVQSSTAKMRRVPPELEYLRSRIETECPKCREIIAHDAPRTSCGGRVSHQICPGK